MRILLPLFTGFEEIEAITVLDVLRRAGLEVVTAGLSPDPVVGAHGLPVLAGQALGDFEGQVFDAIVLPGGSGTPRLAESELLGNMLAHHAAAGRWTAAICAAPTVLGAMGLLRGKAATSWPGVRDAMGEADYREDAVVIDGAFVTSRGPGTAMAFALALVEHWCGSGVAAELRQAMVVS
ncbi:MAG: DJ-1 family glyoxalase III [Candidatus Sericytochromatia bacterium]|nr:DJ-1 family glyoxalase III [Candidatus Sericytochromatia bacterium]